MTDEPIDETTTRLAEEALAALVELSHHEISVAQIRDLDRRFGQPLASMISGSAESQKKAVAKLGPGLWWCTERSVQQATPHRVSEVKANWFPQGVQVTDLCCGIGGDAMGLAKRGSRKDGIIGRVCAIDMDEQVCWMANRNLSRAGSLDFEVRCTDVSGFDAKDTWFHIDPDRRPGNNRVSEPDFYSPAWDKVLEFAETAIGGVIKAAPAAEPRRLPPRCHRIWTSLAGVVREQSIVVGAVAEGFAKKPKS